MCIYMYTKANTYFHFAYTLHYQTCVTIAENVVHILHLVHMVQRAVNMETSQMFVYVLSLQWSLCGHKLPSLYTV